MKTSEKNTLNENRMASGRFCAPVQVMPWEARAAGIIGRLARAGRVFTTDDIWLQLTRAGVAVPTHERRALGGILRPLSGVMSLERWGLQECPRITPGRLRDDVGGGMSATREMHVGALFLATQHLGPASFRCWSRLRSGSRWAVSNTATSTR